MFWTDRIQRPTGAAMLLLVAFVIALIAVESAVVGDADPTKRGDVEGLLRDIQDHQSLFFLGVAFDMASNAILLAAVAPLVYLLFRDRSAASAIVALAALLAAGIVFMVGDAANLAVGVLAGDFVEEGGAGAIPVGDPVVLQSARAVALVGAMTEPIGSTGVALGLLPLGSILLWAPRGDVNPPAWLGALAIVSAVALIVSWVGAVSADLGLALVTIGYVGTMLWFVLLGGWLILRPEQGDAPAHTRRLAEST